MYNIIKSSEVVIDSKKYILSEKIKEKEKDEKKTKNEKKVEKKEDILKIKEEILEEAKVESDEILKETLEEKEKIISDAYDESIRIRENAKKEGFDEGKKEAIESMKSKEKEIIEEALNYKESISSKYDEFFLKREEKMINIVINSVEKILNKKISDDEETIVNLIKKGIENAIFSTEIKIRVSEQDYEAALEGKAKLLAFSKNIKDIEFEIDYSMESGDCIIESENGNVDLGINMQFEKLKKLYLDLLQKDSN